DYGMSESETIMNNDLLLSENMIKDLSREKNRGSYDIENIVL
ncbi:22119_t:CDS:1, partial [Entrophospora sp. SA101]